MAIRVLQLGSARIKDEGIRIGTVRRPPRGVRKEDYSRRDYYDVWLPQLSPSSELVQKIKKGPITASNWKTFERQFSRELSTPDNSPAPGSACRSVAGHGLLNRVLLRG